MKFIKPLRMFAFLALAMISAAAFSAEKVSETTLPNGMKVLIKEVHSAPVVTVDVWYKVGSRNEGPGLTGASHLLEHMTYKGTKEFDKDAMRNLVKRNGAIDNGATFFDYTHYHTTIARDRLELALKMEASRMHSALIRQADLDSERTVVRSELEGRENNPGTLLFQEVLAAAFRVNSYHWPVIGWRADVEHVTAAELQKYYRTYYVPNNATLVIAGDVDSAKALKAAKKYFGGIKRSPQPPQWTTPEPQQYGERRVTVRRQGKIPIEMIVWHVPGISHADVPAIRLLAQILGDGRISRLNQQIVEKQIGVGAWADTLILRDAGLFIAGGYPAPGQPVIPIEKAILDEVVRITSTPPTAEEMARGLRQYEAALIYGRDSITNQASELGEYETTAGDWRYPDKLLAAMRSLKPEDISRAAMKYLTAENRTVGIFEPVSNGTTAASIPEATPAKYHSDPLPLSTVPAAASSPNKVKPNIVRQRFELPNGLVLIAQENHANATIAVSASLKAGKAYDPGGKAGCADMVANLLDRGTATRTSNQIAGELENAAASINTGTGWETVGMRGKALSGDAELLLRNMADLLRNAAFPQEEIDKMREQMLSGLAMERDNPEENARRAFYRSIFPVGNPYRLASFDEEEAGYNGITRNDLLAFHRSRYSPQTMILAVVGDFKIEDIEKLVEKYFGDWAGAESFIVDFTQNPQPKADKVVTFIPDKSEADIYAGYAGGLSRKSPDYYAAEVMNMIIGGGGALNSRLGDVVRDQNGLAYSIYSDFHASTGAGPWYVQLGVNPKNVNKAVSLVSEVITNFRDKGATQQEVSDTISNLTGSYAIALETNSAMANVLMDAEYFQLGLDYPEKIRDLYRAVTLKEVNAAAKKYLQPDQLTVSIAGSYEGK